MKAGKQGPISHTGAGLEGPAAVSPRGQGRPRTGEPPEPGPQQPEGALSVRLLTTAVFPRERAEQWGR